MDNKAKVKLNEELLKRFIADRTKKVSLAKKRSRIRLKMKVKEIKKSQQESSGAETDNQIEMIMQAVSFLSDVQDVYLMSLALLDRKAQSVKYANSNSPKKRAVCQFASDEKIKSAIKVFRKKYLAGSKCRTRLLSKVETNINTEMLVSSLSEVEEEAGHKANGADITASKNGKVSNAKKCKAADDSICSSEKENFKNLSTNETQGALGDGGTISKIKEELNDFNEVLAESKAVAAVDSNLSLRSGKKAHIVFDDDIDSDSEEISGTPVLNNPFGDLCFKDDSNGYSHIPGVPKDSVNLIWVSDDWKMLADTLKTDRQRPSLLRPAWLTSSKQ